MKETEELVILKQLFSNLSEEQKRSFLDSIKLKIKHSNLAHQTLRVFRPFLQKNVLKALNRQSVLFVVGLTLLKTV